MNLTGRPVYQKGEKRKRSRKTPSTPLADLIARAEQKGTERQYLGWLQTQPSALGTGFDYDWDIGYFCVPAHFRTAANSGTGTKPDFYAIPLRHAEHQRQHAIGTFAFMPREWWEDQVRRHLERWITS